MQHHELKPTHRVKTKKRVGRGGKRGTFSGRGTKGQKARAGHKIKPMEREMILKIPKRRGFKFQSTRTQPVGLNIGAVAKHFESGGRVTPRMLLEKGLLKRVGGAIPDVKLLGEGTVAKALLVDGCQISDSAREKVLKAGGTIKE